MFGWFNKEQNDDGMIKISPSELQQLRDKADKLDAILSGEARKLAQDLNTSATRVNDASKRRIGNRE